MRGSFAVVSTAFALLCFGRDAEAAVRVWRPTDPQQIVLQVAQPRQQLELSRLRAAARTAPQELQAQSAYIEALMDAAARTGQERYYGHAEQALESAAPQLRPQLDLLRAQLLQHRHEFRSAERVLSGILDRDPRDRAARLMRAQIRIHLHEGQRAMEDCIALVPLTDLPTATTCVAQSRAALGDVARAYELVIAVLSVPGSDAATRSWSLGIAAELAARLGDSRAAGRLYREAWELDGRNHFPRIAYADWLLATGRAAEALRVANTGTSLADRARAVLAQGRPDSAEAVRLQLAWREAEARGERAHLRDRARFELHVQRDAARAFATARDNFRDHTDAEDALVLAATAAAAGDRSGDAALRAWRDARGYVDRRLDQWLGEIS